jgi:hypothetical protein
VRELLLNVTGVAVLVVPLLCMILYVGYGNRFRATAGRAIMVWDSGSAMLGSIFFLHHPLGWSTDIRWVAWYQICGSLLFVTGVTWLMGLMVLANERWPWQEDVVRPGE